MSKNQPGVILEDTAHEPLVGQQPMVASLPVAIASNQSPVPVSASSLPLPTGAATETTLATRAAAAQLPGALVGGRLDENLGAWLGSTAPTVGQKAMVSSVPVVFASDQSPLTVGISGDLDDGKIFSIATEVNMAAAGTDNPLILLRNPAASGKKLYLWKVHAGTSVTNVAAVFKIYKAPTITANGTGLTEVNRKIGGSEVAVATAFSLPTISALGTKFSSLSLGQNNNAVIFAEDYSVVVLVGQDIVITGDPSSNNRQSVLTVIWKEESV